MKRQQYLFVEKGFDDFISFARKKRPLRRLMHTLRSIMVAASHLVFINPSTSSFFPLASSTYFILELSRNIAEDIDKIISHLTLCDVLN